MPFVIVTSFAVLNLFIALIVNSMQSMHTQDLEEVKQAETLAHNERDALMREITALRRDVQELMNSAAPRARD